MTLAVVIIVVLLAVLGFGYLIFRLMRRARRPCPGHRRDDAKHDLVVGTDEQGRRSRVEDLPSRRATTPRSRACCRTRSATRAARAGADDEPEPADRSDEHVGTTEWIVVVAGRRRAPRPAALHPVLPGAGARRVPDPRLRRPEHLPAVPHDPAGRLPVLRQGARRLLPLHRLPLDAAQLDQPDRLPHEPVPLLLPHDRRGRVRAHAGARHPLHLPQHVRVLLRSSSRPCAWAGTRAAWASGR